MDLTKVRKLNLNVNFYVSACLKLRGQSSEIQTLAVLRFELFVKVTNGVHQNVRSRSRAPTRSLARNRTVASGEGKGIEMTEPA